MADKDTSAALSLNITRGLTDKLVERRKAAALDLEKYVQKVFNRAKWPVPAHSSMLGSGGMCWIPL